MNTRLFTDGSRQAYLSKEAGKIWVRLSMWGITLDEKRYTSIKRAVEWLEQHGFTEDTSYKNEWDEVALPPPSYLRMGKPL